MIEMQDLVESEEEGEIIEDPIIQPYIPIERPSATSAYQSKQNCIDSDESSQSSEESSSDDDRPAKRRKKISSTLHFSEQLRGKSNPWSSVLLEDHIEQELKDINVNRNRTAQERSRDVESYDYSLVLRDRLDNEDLDHQSELKIHQKLKALDQIDGGESFAAPPEESHLEDFEQSLQETKLLLSNSRKRKMDHRNPSQKKHSIKKNPCRVEDLILTEEATSLEVAQEIAKKLHEWKSDLILRAVEILGTDVAIRLFEETKEAESNGGVMVANGSRRRTPGGVFLHFLRNDKEIPMEKIREVFSEEEKAKEVFKRKLRAKRRKEKAEDSNKLMPTDLPELPTRSELEMKTREIGTEEAADELVSNETGEKIDCE